MVRWALILVALAAAAALAAGIAEIPGSAVLDWYGYEITTSVAVLLLAALVLVAVLIGLWLLWRKLVSVPLSLALAHGERRERRGFEAVSRGLVAVAAGDAENARKEARAAQSLLADQPLARLLSAQAAQLSGDDQAATRFFSELREQSATEFLGLRGLLTQALARQDWAEALTLARRAYRLNPNSSWVVGTLFHLQKRAGLWLDAEATLGRSARLNVIPSAAVPRERAELMYRHSLEATVEEALRLAKRAFHADPSYAPAAARYAQLLARSGRRRRAASVVEKAWQLAPDPALAEAYYEARECNDALQRVQAAQRLARTNINHPESRIAIAVAALEARLWGEARSNLEAIAGEDASPRVCRLMAALEEAEHGDLARARTWLMRAIGDDATPQMSSLVPQGVAAPAADGAVAVDALRAQR